MPGRSGIVDHDHQLEHYSILDVKPVELLMQQLRQSTIKLAHVASDARGALSTHVACQREPSYDALM